MKYFEKKRKPIPFLKDWWRIDEENGGFVSEKISEEGEADKTMKQHVTRGKTENFLKTVLDLTLFVQNKRFSWLDWVVSKSPSQIAKILYENFWKICLSVFRNRKVHSWLSREGSHESPE